jgi:ring-1,2-phenylacetyl-CoA epoxidase subunit PaaB
LSRNDAPAAAHGAAPASRERRWGDPLGRPGDVWCVFLQARKRDPHVYVGDVHAPDAEMALVLAKESYARRDPCVNLWVVRLDQIYATPPGAAEIFEPATDKRYRFGGSYREQQKVYRSGWRLSHREEDQ